MWTLKHAIQQVNEMKRQGKIVGFTQGCFDLLHAGHIEHFSLCKESCDFLVVSVVPDKFAKKSPDRPLYNQVDRCKIIENIKCVDATICDDWDDESACYTLGLLKPSVYFRGTEYRDKPDYTNNIGREIEITEKYGGVVKYVSGTVSSSSDIIRDIVGDDTFTGLRDKKHYFDLLDKISQLKVGIVGEGIIDKYIMVESLGVANKYPILSVKELDKREDLGGSYAIYNLLRGIAPQTRLIRFLDKDVVKTRYVDSFKNHKLFETNRNDVVSPDISLLRRGLEEDSDLVLIADFGHGAFTDEVIAIVKQITAFKAFMIQQNSLNQHMNFPWKYNHLPKDVLSLNRKEAIFNSKSINLKEAAAILSKDTSSQTVFITTGSEGAMAFDGSEYESLPCVSQSIEDTIGCGDVFFAISSSVMCVGGSTHDALVMANIFAYLHAQIDGNSKVVTKNDFVLFVRGWMK